MVKQLVFIQHLGTLDFHTGTVGDIYPSKDIQKWIISQKKKLAQKRPFQLLD